MCSARLIESTSNLFSRSIFDIPVLPHFDLYEIIQSNSRMNLNEWIYEMKIIYTLFDLFMVWFEISLMGNVIFTHTHTRSCQRFCRYPRSFLVNVHVGLKQHAAALILPMQCRYQQVLYLKEAACDSTWWFLVLLYQLFDGSVRTRPRVPTTPNHTHMLSKVHLDPAIFYTCVHRSGCTRGSHGRVDSLFLN